MSDIIDRKREANMLYAAHFEGLCKRVYAKYHKVINLCRDGERNMLMKKFNVKNLDKNKTFSMEFLKNVTK